jgi:hypothetical protein
MKSIIQSWSLQKFPDDSTIPEFKFAYSAGPETWEAILTKLLAYKPTMEIMDFDTGDVLSSSEPIRADIGGDRLLVVYDNPSRWVYIISSDLEWAVLLSNIEPSILASSEDWKSAENDFRNSYNVRTTRDVAYYDAQKLLSWSSIACKRDAKPTSN